MGPTLFNIIKFNVTMKKKLIDLNFTVNRKPYGKNKSTNNAKIAVFWMNS